MNVFDFAQIYQLSTEKSALSDIRKGGVFTRVNFLNSLANNQEIVKNAFDTRRINQEIDVLPRRNLQNYHRSDQFITKTAKQKIKNLVKIKGVLDGLKNVYGREFEWQDSYARTLSSTIDKTLETMEKLGDYSESAPSLSGINYLEDLLYTRYRISLANVENMAIDEINSIILNRDENLLNKDLKAMLQPSVQQNNALQSTGQISLPQENGYVREPQTTISVNGSNNIIYFNK